MRILNGVILVSTFWVTQKKPKFISHLHIKQLFYSYDTIHRVLKLLPKQYPWLKFQVSSPLEPVSDNLFPDSNLASTPNYRHFIFRLQLFLKFLQFFSLFFYFKIDFPQTPNQSRPYSLVFIFTNY